MADQVRVRRGRPGYDRERLVAVAVAEFTRRGYDGTSMEDLAAALGLSKSAIYHHVRGKSELLRLAVDQALDALTAVTTEPAATQGAAIDRLTHVVRRSVEVLVAELDTVTLLLRVRGNTEEERAALARRRALDDALTDLVRQAVTEGDLRADVDPALTSRLLFGLVNSVAEWYRPEGSADADALADAVVGLAFQGLRRTS